MPVKCNLCTYCLLCPIHRFLPFISLAPVCPCKHKIISYISISDFFFFFFVFFFFFFFWLTCNIKIAYSGRFVGLFPCRAFLESFVTSFAV